LIAVLRPGLLTTVQDLGRPGYRAWGLPVAGAVDPLALAAANLLAGNPPGTAALELTLLGGAFRFEAGAAAALAGAEMGARLDGVPVPSGSSFRAPAGSTLELGPATLGVRAYLAVRGGIDVPPVLGSRSTYTRAAVGGLEGRALRAGDVLPVGKARGRAPGPRRLSPEDRPGLPGAGDTVTLRVLPGPQDDLLPADALAALLATPWTVTNLNDRMGYRLDGPPLRLEGGADIVTDGLLPGAVQVASDGRPMILLVDAQTAGGYAKPVTVIAPDLRWLGQARAGHRVRLARIGMEEALAAVRAEREAREGLARRLGTAGRGGDR
jgi:antagonist of KipI